MNRQSIWQSTAASALCGSLLGSPLAARAPLVSMRALALFAQLPLAKGVVAFLHRGGKALAGVGDGRCAQDSSKQGVFVGARAVDWPRDVAVARHMHVVILQVIHTTG